MAFNLPGRVRFPGVPFAILTTHGSVAQWTRAAGFEPASGGSIPPRAIQFHARLHHARASSSVGTSAPFTPGRPQVQVLPCPLFQGRVAQSVERLPDMQEAAGSCPASSTQARACSSDGRAPRSQCGGRQFDPGQVHRQPPSGVLSARDSSVSAGTVPSCAEGEPLLGGHPNAWEPGSVHKGT